MEKGNQTLMDVAGVFDSACWNSILLQLGKNNCPENFFNLSKDYFSNRFAYVFNNSKKFIRIIKKYALKGHDVSQGFGI